MRNIDQASWLRPARTIAGMSATDDAFARFLEVLAASLDDHEASGEALASRVHLSRFHFDRLVSAAAGEPPATLRRRILLERAAHRLVTTTDEVLPVAIDAGYASHEAFTRAFSRAYGRPPSRWRRRPTGFRIEAPSDVHFHPPGALRVPADRKVNSMDLLTRMVEHHIWLVAEMLDRADRLPDDILDAPVEISVDGIDDAPTLRSLLARLVGQLAMWDAATHDEPYDLARRARSEHRRPPRGACRLRAGLPLPGAHDHRGRSARRDLRRRHLRSARGVHVRRHGRPRAHVRRPSAHARLWRARGRRHQPISAVAIPCAGSPRACSGAYRRGFSSSSTRVPEPLCAIVVRSIVAFMISVPRPRVGSGSGVRQTPSSSIVNVSRSARCSNRSLIVPVRPA